MKAPETEQKSGTIRKKMIWRSSPNSRVRKTALFETHAIYLEVNRMLQALRETFDNIQVFFLKPDARALAAVCGK